MLFLYVFVLCHCRACLSLAGTVSKSQCWHCDNGKTIDSLYNEVFQWYAVNMFESEKQNLIWNSLLSSACPSGQSYVSLCVTFIWSTLVATAFACSTAAMKHTVLLSLHPDQTLMEFSRCSWTLKALCCAPHQDNLSCWESTETVVKSINQHIHCRDIRCLFYVNKCLSTHCEHLVSSLKLLSPSKHPCAPGLVNSLTCLCCPRYCLHPSL